MVTGLLLAADPVNLYRPGDLDRHGWRLPGVGPPAWAGVGNLQLAPGASDPRAADGGGRGPHDPARDLTGSLYLPPGTPAEDGWVAVIRDRPYVLSQVREVTDPAEPGGGIACVAATVTGTADWGGDG